MEKNPAELSVLAAEALKGEQGGGSNFTLSFWPGVCCS